MNYDSILALMCPKMLYGLTERMNSLSIYPMETCGARMLPDLFSAANVVQSSISLRKMTRRGEKFGLFVVSLSLVISLAASQTAFQKDKVCWSECRGKIVRCKML